jgi:hypothetical protein
VKKKINKLKKKKFVIKLIFFLVLIQIKENYFNKTLLKYYLFLVTYLLPFFFFDLLLNIFYLFNARISLLSLTKS